MNTLENSDEQYVPILLLRVEEAALRLGIGRTSMYRLVMTGEVESVQIGGLRRIPAPCIEEYIDRLRHHESGSGSLTMGAHRQPAVEHLPRQGRPLARPGHRRTQGGREPRPPPCDEQVQGHRRRQGSRAGEAPRRGRVPKAGRAWTVEKWLLRWLEEIARPSIRDSSYQAYRTAITKHLLPVIGSLRLDRLEPEHIEAVYRRMVDAGARPATVHQAHRTLRPRSVRLNVVHISVAIQLSSSVLPGYSLSLSSRSPSKRSSECSRPRRRGATARAGRSRSRSACARARRLPCGGRTSTWKPTRYGCVPRVCARSTSTAVTGVRQLFRLLPSTPPDQWHRRRDEVRGRQPRRRPARALVSLLKNHRRQQLEERIRAGSTLEEGGGCSRPSSGGLSHPTATTTSGVPCSRRHFGPAKRTSVAAGWPKLELMKRTHLPMSGRSRARLSANIRDVASPGDGAPRLVCGTAALVYATKVWACHHRVFGDDYPDYDTWYSRLFGMHARREGHRLALAQQNDDIVIGYAGATSVNAASIGPICCVTRSLSGSPPNGWRTLDVVELAVLPEHRRHGLGQALHDCLLDGLTAKCLLITSSDPDDPAVRLYTRSGVEDPWGPCGPARK